MSSSTTRFGNRDNRTSHCWQPQATQYGTIP
jgi:hypothetical protein